MNGDTSKIEIFRTYRNYQGKLKSGNDFGWGFMVTMETGKNGRGHINLWQG